MSRIHVLTFSLATALLLTGAAAISAATPIGRSVMDTAAGTGQLGFAGDGGPARDAQLAMPSGIAVTADGGYLIADRANNRIRKVDAAGTITTVAGTGVAGSAGDGGAATAAQLNAPSAIAVRPDGSYLIADEGNRLIRLVSATGVMLTVAGGGTPPGTGNGDGALATNARLSSPADVAVTPDGGYLIADTTSARIRKVSPAGIISTIAGSGISGSSGDGGLATNALMLAPTAVATTPDGGFLIADRDIDRVRKVDANGIITTVAGTGVRGFSGDGGPATSAELGEPSGIAVQSDGGFYIADAFNGRVRFVSPTGTITTVGGGRAAGGFLDGQVATDARLDHPRYVALTSTGFLISDQTANLIRRVTNTVSRISVKVTAPRACQKRTFTAKVAVTTANPIKTVTVFVDGHSKAARQVAAFAIGIKARPLKKGRHVVRVVAVDVAGKTVAVTHAFKRC